MFLLGILFFLFSIFFGLCWFCRHSFDDAKLSEQLDLDFWFFAGLSAVTLLLMFLGTLML